MSWNPHVTVAAVIEKDKYFLFVEEKVAGRHVINQPAGHLEDNETLLDAVIRETYEETAWHFTPTELIGVYQWQHPQNKQTFIRFCFTGKLDAHDPHAKLDPDILDTLWLSYEDLLQNKSKHRSPLVLTCVNDYLAGKRYDLNMLQHIIQA